jgi:hypothetical protein
MDSNRFNMMESQRQMTCTTSGARKDRQGSLQPSLASCSVDKDIARFHRPFKTNCTGCSITYPKPKGCNQWSLCLVSTVFDCQGEEISACLWGSLIHTDGCKGNKFCEMLALWPQAKESGRNHLSGDRDCASSRLSGYRQGGDSRTDHERLERPGTVSSSHFRLDKI